MKTAFRTCLDSYYKFHALARLAFQYYRWILWAVMAADKIGGRRTLEYAFVT